MTRITKDFSEILDVVTVTRPGVREHWLSYRLPGGGDLSALSGFPPARTEVLSQFIFGGCRFHDEAMDVMGDVNWPVTWVHGDGCSGESLSGAQAFGISGTPVRSIELDGRVVGRSFEDEDAEFCHLGGILPADASQSRPSQARSAYERMEAALRRAGMDFSNVVRTWIYLENILGWYADFNKVRTAFYQERGVFDGLIPASTGIGAANPSGSALVTGLIAVRPKRKDVTIAAVPSPLQCPATTYRSSFSRAVELRLTGRRHLYVSGTASIGPDGQTVHHGDVDKQIERTMGVCEAILESRRMTWADATRVVVYFKDMRDGPRFAEYCRRRQLPELPLALSHAAVCRDELLFEVELDAVSAE